METYYDWLAKLEEWSVKWLGEEEMKK